jgi:hypothetical protein
MFAELLSTYLRLRKWKDNPAASKRQIGIVSWWLTRDPTNDEPISHGELESMKNFLQAHAPSSYREIFN